MVRPKPAVPIFVHRVIIQKCPYRLWDGAKITCLQNHDIRDLGFCPDHLASDGIVMSCMLIVITDSINSSGFRDQLAA